MLGQSHENEPAERQKLAYGALPPSFPLNYSVGVWCRIVSGVLHIMKWFGPVATGDNANAQTLFACRIILDFFFFFFNILISKSSFRDRREWKTKKTKYPE